MSALSNVDIEREIIKGNILIYPLNPQNIKDASYNLTASKLAWDLQTKKSIYHPDESDSSKPGKIVILPNTTALIETNETIWVCSKICGTYHSTVTLVSKGLGHIGTTLDPEYIGNSLITVHNHAKEPIDIIPEKDTFATLMFYYLKTKSSRPDVSTPGRTDILNQYHLSQEEKDWFKERFRKIPLKLKEKLKEQDEYKNLKKGRLNFAYLSPYLILVLLLILTFSVYLYLTQNQEILKSNTWYDVMLQISDRGTFISATALIVQLITDIRRN